MKFPEKIQNLVDDMNIDIENITIEEINNFFLFIRYWQNNNFSLYNNESLFLRDVIDNKNSPFYYISWNGIDIWIDILLLKLFKNDLIELQLFNAKLNIDTQESKDFYSFLSKYYKKNPIFMSSETWEWEYDIKKIIDNEYEKFIDYIYLNMLPWDEELNEFNIDDIYNDRLEMRSRIPNLKNFFYWISKMFSHLSNISEIKDNFVNEYNSENFEYYEIPFNKYFKWYSEIYQFLEYLENTWKLKIKDIILYSSFDKEKPWLYMRFYYEKIVKKILPIFIENYKKPVEFILHKTWDLEYKWICINFPTENIAYVLLKAVLDSDINNGLDIYDFFEEYENGIWDYQVFKNETIRDAIRNINKRISGKFKIESFLSRPRNQWIIKRKF